MKLAGHIVQRPLFLTAAALVVTFGVGVGLTELIESDLRHQSRLVNVSCRGPSGTGPDSVLAAFVIAERPQTVVVRARGWSAPQPNATEVPRDVLLRVVRNADGVDVARNERWRVAGNERLWGDLKHLAPGDPRHSACVVTLPPGGYSAIVEDRPGQRGLASIEVFVVQQ
jgi:hypothetical protein